MDQTSHIRTLRPSLISQVAAYTTTKPKQIVFVMGVVTAIMLAFAIMGTSLRVVLDEMLPAKHQNVEAFKKYGHQFGGVNSVIISVTNKRGDVYNPAFLNEYRKIADEVYFNEDSNRALLEALSLRKVRAVSGTSGAVQFDPMMWPEVPSTPDELSKFRRLLLQQFGGYYVSADQRSLLIAADFREGSDFKNVYNFLDSTRKKYESADIQIEMVGRPVLLGYIETIMPRILVIFAVSIIVIGIILWLYFRNVIGVVVPIGVSLAVTIVGFGVMGIFRYNLDPLLLLLPFFVFATVLSHAVQFLSRVYEELPNGGEMPDVIRRSLEKFLFPSTAAVLTDAAGFAVLALLTIPSLRSLGIVCTLWLLSLTPKIVVAGALLALTKKPKLFEPHLMGTELLVRIANPKFGKYVNIPIFTLLLIGGIFVSQKLTIGDTVGSPILWDSARYNIDSAKINRDYNRIGTDVMQIYVDGPSETMLRPDVYHRIEGLDRYVYEHAPQATPAQSLVDVVKNVNAVLWEGDPSYQFIPDSADEIGFNIYMFRSRGEAGDFDIYTDSEWKTGKVSIFSTDHRAAVVDSLHKHAANYLASEPKLTGVSFVMAGGQIGLTKAINDEIHSKHDLLFYAIIGTLLLSILLYYRSWKIAVIIASILVMSHFVSQAIMVFMGIGLNINTLPLAALGTARGVDYSIYIIDRIREEFREGKGFREASETAMRTSGQAVMVTAVTMIAPLLAWYFVSPIRFQAEMGLLLAVILALNMAGALLVVPAAIGILRPKGFLKTDNDDIEGAAGARS